MPAAFDLMVPWQRLAYTAGVHLAQGDLVRWKEFHERAIDAWVIAALEEIAERPAADHAAAIAAVLRRAGPERLAEAGIV